MPLCSIPSELLNLLFLSIACYQTLIVGILCKSIDVGGKRNIHGTVLMLRKSSSLNGVAGRGYETGGRPDLETRSPILFIASSVESLKRAITMLFIFEEIGIEGLLGQSFEVCGWLDHGTRSLILFIASSVEHLKCVPTICSPPEDIRDVDSRSARVNSSSRWRNFAVHAGGKNIAFPELWLSGR